MFTLLNPTALFALLGLLVPVAIHLWNRRPGREVAVGSLRWLAAGANRRLRQLRPAQLALLAVRAALLALLALAGAGPAWRRARPPAPRGGQVLLGPEVVGTPALAALRPTLDSLRRRGYGLRWLAAGFPKLAGGRAGPAAGGSLRDSARRLLAADPAAGLRWARVRQAAGVFAGQPLYVVVPADLRGFQGAHPPLRAAVTWRLLPTGPAETWLEQATSQGDSLGLLLGQSTATQTSFRRVMVGRPRPGAAVRVAGLPPLRFEAGVGGSRLRPLGAAPAAAAGSSWPADSRPAVPVLPQPGRVLIYSTSAYAPDARCLQAGLRAAALGLPGPLAVRLTATPPDPTAAPPDWLFWLSDAPLPAAWRPAVRRGTQVWQEATGPGVADTARAQLPAATTEALVTVIRRGAARPTGAATVRRALPLWLDSRGRALLARQGVGKGAFYYLDTRLNPAWSDFADSPALPAALLTLLAPAPTDEAAPAPAASPHPLAAHDQRALDPAQLDPETTLLLNQENSAATPPAAAAAAARPGAQRLTDLRPWFGLAAALLFALERGLAARREAHHHPATLTR